MTPSYIFLNTIFIMFNDAFCFFVLFNLKMTSHYCNYFYCFNLNNLQVTGMVSSHLEGNHAVLVRWILNRNYSNLTGHSWFMILHEWKVLWWSCLQMNAQFIKHKMFINWSKYMYLLSTQDPAYRHEPTGEIWSSTQYWQ